MYTPKNPYGTEKSPATFQVKSSSFQTFPCWLQNVNFPGLSQKPKQIDALLPPRLWLR